MTEDVVLVNQKITIRSTDRVQFMKTIVEYASRGAKIVKNSTPRMIVPFTLDMEIDVDKNEPIKSSVNVIAYPIKIPFYTYNEVCAMDWDTFRKVCKEQGIKGRDREKMTEEYLSLLRN